MGIFFYGLRKFDELDICRKLSGEYGVPFAYTEEQFLSDTLPLSKGFDAISIMESTSVDADLLDRAKAAGIQYILCRTIGYDHVDTAHAKKIGLRVSNTGYPPNSVANYAIMLMLACSRKLKLIIESSRCNDFTLQGKMGLEISDSTVGIIGTGHIGSTVARHLRGFGCRLLGYDLYRNRDIENFVTYVDLDTLLRESDIITLHMNATEENHYLINDETISKMKDHVILINTARGKLVDTDALIRGIKSGKIGGAGLDVTENEHKRLNYIDQPLDDDKLAILRSFPNVIHTPHTAFYTEKDVYDMSKNNFESYLQFREGKACPFELTK